MEAGKDRSQLLRDTGWFGTRASWEKKWGVGENKVGRSVMCNIFFLRKLRPSLQGEDDSFLFQNNKEWVIPSPSQKTWVPAQFCPLLDCVALDKLLTLSAFLNLLQ